MSSATAKAASAGAPITTRNLRSIGRSANQRINATSRELTGNSRACHSVEEELAASYRICRLYKEILLVVRVTQVTLCPT